MRFISVYYNPLWNRIKFNVTDSVGDVEGGIVGHNVSRNSICELQFIQGVN